MNKCPKIDLFNDHEMVIANTIPKLIALLTIIFL